MNTTDINLVIIPPYFAAAILYIYRIQFLFGLSGPIPGVPTKLVHSSKNMRDKQYIINNY